MDANELVKHAERIRDLAGSVSPNRSASGIKAQVCEFLRSYVGPKSAFFKEATEVRGSPDYQGSSLATILDHFIDYVRAGLSEGISPERRAQLDVVSDFLAQALSLLNEKGVHPAAAAVLAGAALEEFLRTWVETESLSIGTRKPGIDVYATTLRDAELIDKQDIKDITAWAGLRNHAAHGEWEEVADKKRIAIMIEGINLFMRRYER